MKSRKSLTSILLFTLAISTLSTISSAHADLSRQAGDRTATNNFRGDMPNLVDGQTGTVDPNKWGWDSFKDSKVCTAPSSDGVSCNSIRRDFYSHGNLVSLDDLWKSRGDHNSQNLNGNDSATVSNTATAPQAASAILPGYTTPQIRSAYYLSGTGNGNQVLALVDAYYYPSALSDINSYRSHYGSDATPLASCPTNSSGAPVFPGSGAGCFAQINQAGNENSYPAVNSGWNLEEALDIDMATGICPSCSIVLVAANSASMSDLNSAVGAAANLPGVVSISNSYGTTLGETSEQSLTPNNYSLAASKGIAVTASSGDNGYRVASPASFSSVIGVGGTALTLDANGNRSSEVVASFTGSGCSAYAPKPSWQNIPNSICANKVVSDVSAIAENVLVILNDSTYVVGGTSVSSPIIAAIYALANSAGSGMNIQAASRLWNSTNGFYDVTSGNNGSCSVSQLCTAGAGWDGPTGLGTPNGLTGFQGTAVSNPVNQANLILTSDTTTATVGGNINLSTSGGSGTGGVTYASTSPCTVTGSVVTSNTVGSCTVTATKAASPGYLVATSNTLTLNFTPKAAVAQAPLSITNTVLSTYALSSITVTTAGGSGTGAVTISAAGNSNCIIVGMAISAASATTCTITATKAASTGYLAATSAPVNFVFTLKPGVSQAPLVISNTNLIIPIGYSTVLTTTGGSGTGAVTYAVTGSTCSINATVLYAVLGTKCVVTATKAASAGYDAVSSAPVTFTFVSTPTLPQAPIVITNTTLTNYAGVNLNVTFSGGSGNGTVSFNVTGNACSFAGSTLVTTAVTTCVVTVSKAANGGFLSATSAPVTFTFTNPPAVAQAPLIITNTITTTSPGMHYSFGYRGGSGSGAVTGAVTGSGCTIDSSTLTVFSNVPTVCVVTLTKAASLGYLAISSAPFSLTYAAPTTKH